MTEIGFSLGSNVGDKIANISNALDLMNGLDGLQIEKASSYYKTPPWGITDQDWFVNVCALGFTDIEPRRLMQILQGIENELGRQKSIRWGPRLIDIDILYYGDVTVDEDDLTIPHKSMCEREFVLIPLLEIRPDYSLRGKLISEVVTDKNMLNNEITRLKIKPWHPS